MPLTVTVQAMQLKVSERTPYILCNVLWLVCEGALCYLWYWWFTACFTAPFTDRRPQTDVLTRCQVLHPDTLEECIEEETRRSTQEAWLILNFLSVAFGGLIILLLKFCALSDYARQLQQAGVLRHIVTAQVLFHLLVWHLLIVHIKSVSNCILTGQYDLTAADVTSCMYWMAAGAVAACAALYFAVDEPDASQHAAANTVKQTCGAITVLLHHSHSSWYWLLSPLPSTGLSPSTSHGQLRCHCGSSCSVTGGQSNHTTYAWPQNNGGIAQRTGPRCGTCASCRAWCCWCRRSPIPSCCVSSDQHGTLYTGKLWRRC